MPRVRTSPGSSPTEENVTTIDTRTVGALTDQLRILTDKLDRNQREVASAKAQAKEANDNATSLRIRIQELQDHKPDTYVFQFRGNEIQFKTNIAIIADITRAMTAMENGYIDEAIRHHKRAIAALMLRNKHIKIADASPDGWALVDEYMLREAASDDEDDRKLRRAEVSLEAKNKRKADTSQRGARGGKRGKFAGRGAYSRYTGGQAYENPSYDTSEKEHSQGYSNSHYVENDQGPWTEQNNKQESRPQTRSVRRQNTQNTGYPARGQGPCFYCKGPHMRNVCPLLAARAAEVQASIEATYYTEEPEQQ